MKANALAHVVPLALALTFAAGCGSKAPTDRARASGSVEATEVQISAQVGGRLMELKVVEGDRVAVGQTIAQLDTTDILLVVRRATADRDLAAAQLALLLAGSRQEDIRQAERAAERRRGRHDRCPRRPCRGRSRPRPLRHVAQVELGHAETARRRGCQARPREGPPAGCAGARTRGPRGVDASRTRRPAGGDRCRPGQARRHRGADRLARAERQGRDGRSHRSPASSRRSWPTREKSSRRARRS